MFKKNLVLRRIAASFLLICGLIFLAVHGECYVKQEGGAEEKNKKEVTERLKTLRIPFIPNHGQIDERVKFYARTFGGTVFVTGEGELIYSLPFRDGSTPSPSDQVRGRLYPPHATAIPSTLTPAYALHADRGESADIPSPLEGGGQGGV